MFELDKYKSAVLYSQLQITGILMNNCNKRFKIGKTAQDLEDRFAQNYKGKYSKIIKIYAEVDLKLIDSLERELIEYYMKYYPTKCDNDQIGGGPDCSGEVGYVYMVIE